MREKGVALDGWESGDDLGGVGGGQAIVRTYCMKNIFQ